MFPDAERHFQVKYGRMFFYQHLFIEKVFNLVADLFKIAEDVGAGIVLLEIENIIAVDIRNRAI